VVIDFLQITLDGLLDGGSYAIVGLGLSLTFGGLRRLNLAYGATAMLAAYLGAWLHVRLQAPVWLVALTVVVSATVIGWYVERLCFAGTRDEVAPSRGAPRHLNPFPSLAASGEWALGPLMLRPDRLLVALLAVGLVFGLAMWLERSRTGLAWRATADQRTAAHLSGMPVARQQTWAFSVACALSGVAAFAVLSIDGQVTPMFGMWVLLKGLVAAMLGGLGSVRGVLWGGLLLGVVEAHAQALFGAAGREFSTYALLFVALVVPWRRGAPGALFGGLRA
jgi:branched-subunit amino acid ABC-type transport system permease component